MDNQLENECHKAKYENKNTGNSYFAVIVLQLNGNEDALGKRLTINIHSLLLKV